MTVDEPSEFGLLLPTPGSRALTKEERWSGAADPSPLLDLLPALTLRRHLLFAGACCRLMSDWLIDARSRAAVDVAEAFADAGASLNDLEDATNRAAAAARIVGGAPARIVSHAFYGIERDHRVGRRAAERGAVDRGLVENSITSQLRRLLDEIVQVVGGGDPSQWPEVRLIQARLLRDIFGNPFRPVAFDPAWRTSTAVSLAGTMYDSREFSPMPILADALQDAGCDSDDILGHCRGGGPHVRGCWVVDLIMGKS